MGCGCVRRSSRNFELFDLLFDFVDEVGGTGAIDDSVIESERESNHFRALVLFPIRNYFAMRGAHEKRSNRWRHNDWGAGFHAWSSGQRSED